MSTAKKTHTEIETLHSNYENSGKLTERRDEVKFISNKKKARGFTIYHQHRHQA